MWVCMVGMCRGWREGGIGGGCLVGEWRVAWRGRRVGKPPPTKINILFVYLVVL